MLIIFDSASKVTKISRINENYIQSIYDIECSLKLLQTKVHGMIYFLALEINLNL